MDYHKIHHPLNFRFASTASNTSLDIDGGAFPYTVTKHADDVTHLVVDGRWAGNDSQAVLSPPAVIEQTDASLQISTDARVAVSHAGNPLLSGESEASFGVCGQSWMIEFTYDPDMRFYGFGEKLGHLEKTGARTKFWNTDVFADFHHEQIIRAHIDPMYVSIPWVVVKCKNGWAGILINNPHVPFVSAGGEIGAIANQQGVTTNQRFYIGADDGTPDLWFITADTLAELTRRYQRLVGVTPLPPVWALGHQQCRWGYASFDHLKEVQANLAKYDIPTSGLWLDIEYMHEYRVFTWDTALWEDVPAQLGTLQSSGQKVVPIIDPGVKMDPGYAIYDDGVQMDAFCHTPEGEPFVGFVWPGATLFPDYANEDASAWWAGHVKEFLDAGIYGAWLDMNDPSVGPVELGNMCFDKARLSHAAYHSQYGYGMARATHAGMLASHPETRPFLLSRSGWISGQRYTALWTGDNYSNEAYMRSSIPCTLNLALSGVPLNGPDVPGFCGDASASLAQRWYQLGFLFPFLRNHAVNSARAQEPYSYASDTREMIAHLIRLRHRLIPYLYQLWIAQEETGEAVMRPLLYDFDACTCGAIDKVEDQFLIGPALMQAPMTTLDGNARDVLLPPGDWYDMCHGAWLTGDQCISVELDFHETPLYAREGSVIPMLPQEPTDHTCPLETVDLHCFLRAGTNTTYRYCADDGESFAYQNGLRSQLTLDLQRVGDTLSVRVTNVEEAFKPLALRIVVYGEVQTVKMEDGATVALEPFTWRATGSELACKRSAVIPLRCATPHA